MTSTSPRTETAEQQEKTPLAQQEDLLKEAKKQVEIEAYRMRRALDKNQLEEALKHSAKMLNELRTNSLSPKNYYDLYMIVFDQLRHLEMYFDEERSKGRHMQDLYEVVQHAGNIVPRLYLLITVGSVYIKSKQAPVKDILKDLVEMCKGVQHPTRGLFLRNYLSQIAKDKLPDTGSEYEGFGGNVQDAINFVLQNFNEMVFLFSRLKNEGPVKERQKREKERYDLRILIGTNLVRLSQLEGVTLSIYKDVVLPKVIEIVINSNDKIAQQYLMECIIQVFPDEFHIATLHSFLSACMQLLADVDLKTIFTSLMDRLANYAKQFPEQISRDVNVIEVFSSYIEKIDSRGVEIADKLAIQMSLMSLTLQTYPKETDYVNKIINAIAGQLTDQLLESDEVVELLKRFLLIPVDAYQNVLTVLELEKYGEIVARLGYEQRKFVALKIARAALEFGDKISSFEIANKFFELIKPLLKDENDQTIPTSPEDSPATTTLLESFEEEQNLVARIVHLLDNEDTDQLFRIYAITRKYFGQGGVKRIQYTLVPLVFSYLRLAQRIHTEKDESKVINVDKVFKYVLEILQVYDKHKPGTALVLYLQAAQCADQCGVEKLVYEFLTQAFMLYEDEDSKVQLNYLTLIINTLHNMKNMSAENYDTLSTKTCQYSSKLLRKPDQCRAAFMCSHLFWPFTENPELQNSSKALECLQWSLKIVKACMVGQQIPLFVDILNVYMYHFDKNNDKVTCDYINGLIDLINTNITNVEEEEGADETFAPINVFYRNTTNYLKSKKLSNPEGNYKGINL
jgi:vacuolar protein sorting-associated protein 35